MLRGNGESGLLDDGIDEGWRMDCNDTPVLGWHLYMSNGLMMYDMILMRRREDGVGFRAEREEFIEELKL